MSDAISWSSVDGDRCPGVFFTALCSSPTALRESDDDDNAETEPRAGLELQLEMESERSVVLRQVPGNYVTISKEIRGGESG